MCSHDILVILNYASVLVTFASAVIISLQTSGKMQKLAMLVSISLTVCCIGFLMKSEAKAVETYIAGQKIAYFFVTHCMFLMLLFVLEYCRFSIPKFVEWIFHGLNFFVSFSVLTLDYHSFFYKSYYAIPMDGFILVEKEYGILHTFAVALFGFYMIAGLVIAIIFSVKNIRKKSRYVWRILIAYMLPCTVYVVTKLLDGNNDYLSIAGAAFSIMMIIMIYRNNLYDVDNIAVKFTIESTEEAFVVFDDKYRFKGCNQKAYELFPELKKVDLDGDIREISSEFTGYIDGDTDEFRTEDRIYGISVRSIVDGMITHGKVLKIEDVTMQRHYTDLLKASKDQYDKDMAMGKSIQLSVLPNPKDVFAQNLRIDAAAMMETAREVGGDFYDLFMLDKDRAAFLVADVSGKGIPAALFMMRAKTTIRSLTEEGLPVNEVFEQANERLCQENDAHMFVTAWLCIADLNTGHITFANAGHNPPAVVHQDGTCELLKSRPGIVLAAMEGVPYRLQQYDLAPGDKLFLYTDGVTEATSASDELYGEKRLLEVLQRNYELSSEDTMKAVKTDIDKFVGEAEQFDDITMVVFRMTGR